MNASHDLQVHVSEKKLALEVNAANSAKAIGGVAAIYEKSESSMVSAMEQYQKQEQRLENRERKEREAANARQMFGEPREAQVSVFNLKVKTAFPGAKTGKGGL